MKDRFQPTGVLILILHNLFLLVSPVLVDQLAYVPAQMSRSDVLVTLLKSTALVSLVASAFPSEPAR